LGNGFACFGNVRAAVFEPKFMSKIEIFALYFAGGFTQAPGAEQDVVERLRRTLAG
jgi:hypothetical protein